MKKEYHGVITLLNKESTIRDVAKSSIGSV